MGFETSTAPRRPCISEFKNGWRFSCACGAVSGRRTSDKMIAILASARGCFKNRETEMYTRADGIAVTRSLQRTVRDGSTIRFQPGIIGKVFGQTPGFRNRFKGSPSSPPPRRKSKSHPSCAWRMCSKNIFP